MARKQAKRRNILRGRKAQSVGELWEKEIDLRAASLSGVIFIKQFPKIKFFGKGVAKVVGVGWADYIAIGKNLSFTFDAKTTRNKKKLTLPHDTRHQFTALQNANDVGVPAFYLVHWRDSDMVTVNLVNENSEWPLALSIDGDFSVIRDENWLSSVVSFISHI